MQRLQYPLEGESDVTSFDERTNRDFFVGITLDWLAKNAVLIANTTADKYKLWYTEGHIFHGPLPREVANSLLPICEALTLKGAEKVVARIDENVNFSYLVYANGFPPVKAEGKNLRIGGRFRPVKVYLANAPPIQRFASFLGSLAAKVAPQNEFEYNILERDSKKLYRIFLEQFFHGVGSGGLEGVYYSSTKFFFIPSQCETLKTTDIDPSRSSFESFFFADAIKAKMRTVWRSALGASALSIFKKRCAMDSGDARVEEVKRNTCTTYAPLLQKSPKEKETYGGMEDVIDLQRSSIPEDLFPPTIRLGRVLPEPFLIYDKDEKEMKVSPTVNQVILRNLIYEESRPEPKPPGKALENAGGMEKVGLDVFTFSSDPSDRSEKFFTFESMLNALFIYMRKSDEVKAFAALVEIWRLQEIGEKVITQILNKIASVVIGELDLTVPSNRKLISYIINLSIAFSKAAKENLSYVEVISLVSRVCSAEKGRAHCIADYRAGMKQLKFDRERLLMLERRVKEKDAIFVARVQSVEKIEEITESEEGQKYAGYFKMLCYLLFERDEECYTWLNYYFSTNEQETKYLTPNLRQLTGLNVLFEVIAHILERDVANIKAFYKRRNYYYIIYLIYICLNGYKEDLIDINQKAEDLERAAQYASILENEAYTLKEEPFLSYKSEKNLDFKIRYWQSTFDLDVSDPYFSELDALNKDLLFG